MNSPTAAAKIAFDYPGEPDHVVPVDQAFAYSDAAGKWLKPNKVVWEDGTSSFATGLWFNNNLGAGLAGVYTLGGRAIIQRSAPKRDRRSNAERRQIKDGRYEDACCDSRVADRRNAVVAA